MEHSWIFDFRAHSAPEGIANEFFGQVNGGWTSCSANGDLIPLFTYMDEDHPWAVCVECEAIDLPGEALREIKNQLNTIESKCRDHGRKEV